MDGSMGMDSIGAFLRHEREIRQVSLEELVQQTRIPLRMLQRIEDDRFEELPGEVFTRGFLRSYARALSLDADKLLTAYADGRKAEPPAPAPLLASIQTPERGRRFGIAIALVILVILFTLALSIVLNARHRNTPLELSENSQEAGKAGRFSGSEKKKNFPASRLPVNISSLS
jgi:cytoskeletal protein RodZ